MLMARGLGIRSRVERIFKAGAFTKEMHKQDRGQQAAYELHRHNEISAKVPVVVAFRA